MSHKGTYESYGNHPDRPCEERRAAGQLVHQHLKVGKGRVANEEGKETVV